MRPGPPITTRLISSTRFPRFQHAVPEMREVRNWYFDLPGLSNVISDYVDALESDPCIGPHCCDQGFGWLTIIYIKVELHDKYLEIH